MSTNFYERKDCPDGKILHNGKCQDIRDVAAKDGGSVYWVDANNGDDSNPGTEQKPFATISRTTQSGFLNPGDWVIIKEGTYREEIRPQEDGAVVDGETKYITWAAYSKGKVIVSGADVTDTTWTLQGDNTWKADWIWDGLFNDTGASAIERRELFVDDGKPLIPVETQSDVSPGEFYVDGGEEGSTPNAVYLRTHDDTDPNNHKIEVGQRGQLFQKAGEDDFNCGNSGQYYRLIGIEFRHAASHSQRGLCPGAKGTVMEEVTSRENNGAGFKVIGDNHTLRGVKAINNGRTGLSGADSKNVFVNRAEMKDNNYRGHSYFDESGGGKFVKSVDAVFRNLYSHDNNGPGFWIDIKNDNITVERSVFDNNIGFGLNIELKSRNCRIVNNVFSRTAFEKRPQRGFGILVQLGYNNLIAFNTFIKNGEGGIQTFNDDRDKDPTFAPTRSRYNHIYNNLFVNNLQDASPEEMQMQLEDVEEGNETFTVYSNESNGNAFWPSNAGKGFGELFLKPDPSGGTGNFRVNSLSAWKEGTIHDEDSFVVQTGKPHVVDPTDASQGWRLVRESQLRGRAVRLPDKFDPVKKDFDGDTRSEVGADIGADEF